MHQKIKGIIKVEWIAQELLKQYETSGPLIKSMIDIIPDTIQLKGETFKPSQYLIIQGSFDPPTSSHMDLIIKAIRFRSKLNPSDPVKLMLLLSLSHVDKQINVIKRSLLGFRVEMLDKLFSSLDLNVPVSIGLSNVARYIDLIDAAQQFSNKKDYISFIMGMDVFKKLLDPRYYSRALEQVLPLIFRADYFVAGRKDVFSKEEFHSFLSSQLHPKFHEKVYFISLSKSYRFLNATSIRNKYANKQPIQEAYIQPTIRKHLSKDNIYRLTPKWIATKIAIQSIVQLTLTADKDQRIATEILKRLLPEIESDIHLQQKIISEYQSGKKMGIRKKWNQLVSQIS